ncbi:hypothetical protein GCM10020001_075210 [Nonomuraea salmonea]
MASVIVWGDAQRGEHAGGGFHLVDAAGAVLGGAAQEPYDEPLVRVRDRLHEVVPEPLPQSCRIGRSL